MSLREKIDAAFEAAGKPKPFTITSLGGLEVFIASLGPRQVREWWVWKAGGTDGKTKPIWDQILAEAFARFCVDADGKRVYADAEDAARLREQKGGGAALEEFYAEAVRVNWLFESEADAVKERKRLIAELEEAKKKRAAELPPKKKPSRESTSSSTSSPPPGEKPMS